MRAIDADALIKKAYDEAKGMAEQYDDFGVLVEWLVGKSPTIEPERKKGKWTYLDECANAGYYCDQCNKRVVKDGWSKTVKKINFCPNCGADMRGGNDGQAD